MRMISSLKSYVLVTVCLLSVGTIPRLAAQQTITGPIIFAPSPKRVYSGPVTQTTAGGVMTVGTITLSYYKGGGLVAETVLNGVTIRYSGSLLITPPYYDLISPGSKGARTSGVLNSFDRNASPGQPIDASVTITAQLPVFVDKSVAFGGFQNADGGSLTFRANRTIR